MKLRAIIQHEFFRPACGAVLAVFCGLALWASPLGEGWVNISYDYLFGFGHRGITNQVVLILMDNAAFKELRQTRGQHWDRRLHAQMLEKLAAADCPLVVFDVWFGAAEEAGTDTALAAGMRRLRQVVLMAKFIAPAYPESGIGQVFPPHERFLTVATNVGIAKTDAHDGETARRHWPFPAPQSSFVSLPWKAAELSGAHLNELPEEQWLRYYGEEGPWQTISYHLALSKDPAFFHDKTVFIGEEPENSDPAVLKNDKFGTPYTRWHKREAFAGVKIMATTFLNLLKGDWLRRPSIWIERLLLVLTGASLGWGLCQTRPLAAFGIAAGAGLTAALGAVVLSYFTNYWFPWMIVAGGQVPCALAYALLARKVGGRPGEESVTRVLSEGVPDTPDYELIQPPFGQGAYGKVWLTRNAVGEWQALKAVYEANFRESSQPYEREFRGIRRYKPVSDKHRGLLRVDFVSRKKREGYFYYVMELGDAEAPGWENQPATYKPRDLVSLCAQAPGKRLPVTECVRIANELADALSFLHEKGLIHRDIKPSNIVFVNAHPKLADVGLVADVKQPTNESTWVGTPGYMPPPPEPPGTVQADIYALGMVLYVISTGREPAFFPELSATLIERAGAIDFLRLNAIIMRACNPDRTQRYATAAEIQEVLQETLEALERNPAC